MRVTLEMNYKDPMSHPFRAVGVTLMSCSFPRLLCVSDRGPELSDLPLNPESLPQAYVPSSKGL